MKIYFVRLIVEAELCELGIVVANDDGDLFNILDEFTDPGAYEFCSARAGDAVFYPARWGTDADSGVIERDSAYEDVDKAKEASGPFLSEQTIEQKMRRRWRRFTASDIEIIDEHHARRIVETAPCA